MKTIKDIFNKSFYIPKLENLSRTIMSFSILEKIIFFSFIILFIITSLSMLIKVNNEFLVEIPKFGGTLREGVIGTPRFINPVIAISDADKDVTSLVYSGLMRISLNGELIPDLAEKYEISEDGLEYKFLIKENAKFHDGENVTADDVIFTILQTQDPQIKSPRRANWDSITIEKVSDREIIFRLNQPYTPFIFNTTMGILPEHLWKDISSEEFAFSALNIEPIGSGPYKIHNIKRDSSGTVKEYELKDNKDFTLGRPYIETVVVHFYRNEQELVTALQSKEVNSINGISPKIAKSLENNFRIEQLPLPRVFGIFFNPSEAPILANKNIRKALNIAVPKKELINKILEGYGNPLEGPIPENLIPFDVIEGESDEKGKDEALSILLDLGWENNEEGFLEKDGQILSFSISTGNIPELVNVAEFVIDSWKSIGADITLKVFETNDLTNNVIRPRRYDSLLFGEIIGRDLDFYAFWHSSQRNDPGLNIANYTNIDVDSFLEKTRTISDEEEKISLFRKFEQEIAKDNPAVFLYTPDFIYIVPKNLKGDLPKNISNSSDRFINIHNLFLETDTVWSIFK